MMSRGPQTFRQSDLTRALKGAKAAGIEIARIKIAVNGKIEIDTVSSAEAAGEARPDSKEWDEALK